MSEVAPSSARRPIRVAMVTAPAADTAIGMYAVRLTEALRKAGIDAVHLEHANWSWRGIQPLFRALTRLSPDLVHYQFPMGAYGGGPTIQFAALLRPGVTTLHEASNYGPVRGRAKLLPFTLRSQAVIVTSALERVYLVASAPWVRRRTVVIPIASNVPERPRHPSPARTVVYFGSIRPDKGIETFLETAARWRRAGDATRFAVIGTPTPTQVAYAAGLRSAESAANVEWVSGLNDDDAADLLADSGVAYLPFPDGLSARRGSFLAAAGCGLPVVTRPGRHTSPDLAAAAAMASTPDEADAAIKRLLADPAAALSLAEKARAYAARFAWEAVAAEHARLYTRLLRR